MTANEVEIRITSVDRSGPGFDSATRRANQLAAAMRQTGQITNQVLNSITQNANQAGQALHNMGQQGQQGGQQVGGAAGQAGGLMGKLGAAGAAAGAAIGVAMAGAAVAIGAVKKALDASIERANVGAKVGAQIGGTDPKRVAELGKLAGAVYADNFGESLQAAGNAVRDVIRNKLVPADAGDAAVKAISEKLLTLGDIAEADTAEVSRAIRQMLQTGLVKSSEEAFDVLTRGFQEGVDAGGDLLDTFGEYGTQFRKLGLDGATAMGLLNQGLKAGARDADIVADALKEFSIRAIDGSKATQEGFKALGLDATAMGKKIAGGGKGASEGLQEVLAKLKNIKDPVLQAAAATALFGTQSEDLGKALYSLDVSKATDELGKIEGAADRAGAALGGGLGPMIETFKRKAQQALADVGDKIAPFIESAVEAWRGFASGLADVFDGSEVPGEVMESLRTIAEDYGPKLKEVLGGVVDTVRENKGAFETLGRVLADVVLPVLGFLILDALVFVGAAIENCIRVIGFMVEAWQALNRVVIPALAEFLQFLLGFFGSVVNAAAKAFGWIPGIGPKLERAAEEFNEFAREANNALSNIKDHDVYVRTHFVGGQGQARGGEYRTGGITGGMSAAATGGIRQGLVKVGEEGAEFVRLPTGSMVYPKANTNQMQAMAGGSSAPAVTVHFTGDADSALWQAFMQAQRTGAVTILSTAIS